METEIIKMALSQGVFATLFIWLLFYVLKENARREQASSQREEHYQKIIHDIAEKLTGIVCSVQDDVKVIKDKIFR